MKITRYKEYSTLVLKGFCMGVADIIPGISGGTIAFLLGIYEELIRSIKSFDLNFVKLFFRFRFKEAFGSVEWKFLAAVCAGIITAIVTLSQIISWLLINKSVYIHAFFFGLILATVPIIARIIKTWTTKKILIIALAAVVTYVFVGLVPLVTPEAFWFLFLSGAIAICAMILPGISGAFILVLLGKYQYILDAVNQRDMLSIGVFVLGVAVGIFTFVRVLSWLFDKYHDNTVAIIAGIVIGSLRKIWPWKQVETSLKLGQEEIIIQELNYLPAQFNGEVFWAIVIMVIGLLLALKLNAPSKKLLS